MNIRSVTAFTALTHPLNLAAVAPIASAIREVVGGLETAGYTVQTTRLAIQPVHQIVTTPADLLPFARDFETACTEAGIAFCALGPFQNDAPDSLLSLIPDLLANSSSLFTSVEMASPAAGINVPRLGTLASLIRAASTITPDGLTTLRLAGSANLKPWGPFFPTGYHGGGRPRLAIATESAGLALTALRESAALDEARSALIAAIEGHARTISAVVGPLADRHGLIEQGIDFSFAPFPDEARSIGGAIEAFGLPYLGAHGSLLAAAWLTDTLNRADFRKTGFCGLMLPVLEDSTLATRASEGRYTVNDLLLTSAVCGTGLDTVPLPGDVSEEALLGILLDVSALALRLDKPLTARLMPLPGKAAGELTAFDFEYFTNGRILAVRDGVGGMLRDAGMVGVNRTSESDLN